MRRLDHHCQSRHKLASHRYSPHPQYFHRSQLFEVFLRDTVQLQRYTHRLPRDLQAHKRFKSIDYAVAVIVGAIAGNLSICGCNLPVIGL